MANQVNVTDVIIYSNFCLLHICVLTAIFGLSYILLQRIVHFTHFTATLCYASHWFLGLCQNIGGCLLS